jgi:ABC-type Zn uptake system ZnuABC Zn-binding protein ZnuA
MPDEGTLDAISSDLDGQAPRCILWESEPTSEVAGALHSALGLKSIVFSPCEVLDDTPGADRRDFLTVMNDNVDRLREAFDVDASTAKP